MVVDTLSHRRHVTLSLTLSVYLRSHILQELSTDTWLEVSREIDSSRPLEDRFSSYVLELDGLLHYLGRIYVPLLDECHTLILSETHHAPYSVHLGVKKMNAYL